jgi:hypothetical protein
MNVFNQLNYTTCELVSLDGEAPKLSTNVLATRWTKCHLHTSNVIVCYYIVQFLELEESALDYISTTLIFIAWVRLEIKLHTRISQAVGGCVGYLIPRYHCKTVDLP